MPIPVILPKFGFTLESCEIIEWLRQPGDKVREGDPLAEVETDKVNMEVEATADGTVFALVYDEGDDVPVTEVICYLLAPGEEAPADWTPPEKKLMGAAPSETPTQPATETPPASQDIPVTPVAQRVAEDKGVDLRGVNGTGVRGKIMRQDVERAVATPQPIAPTPQPASNGKVAATPNARRIAAQHNVDLSQILGTGPNGRVQGFDVEHALEAGIPEPTQPIPRPQPQSIPSVPIAQGEPEIIPLKGMRKTIARRLQQSYQQAPHIFFDATVNMAEIIGLRKRLKAAERPVSVTALIVKACAWTLRQHPYMNATFDGENITLWNTANIGVAVALDNGLVVPVIQAADQLSLGQINAQVADLATRAREGGLMPDDMQGGTFSVSNLGMYGVNRFTAIINPPQVAIIAIGRTEHQFVPDADGNPVLRPMMNITVSADHRVVDGAQVAQFIRDLKMALDDPALLMY